MPVAAPILVADTDDVIIIKSRARTLASISGRYVLADKRNIRRERRQFACRTLSVSPDFLALAGPVCGDPGERVIAHFDELGRLEGRIVQPIVGGFAMSIAMPDAQRAALAARIDWIDRHKKQEVPDGRKYKRTIPKSPYATLVLADGRVMTCFVIDMSRSGVAISADHMPMRGEVLAVGKIIGRVVRIFPEGFALRFVELQHPDDLERRLFQT
jgi:hypothetical protein